MNFGQASSEIFASMLVQRMVLRTCYISWRHSACRLSPSDWGIEASFTHSRSQHAGHVWAAPFLTIVDTVHNRLCSLLVRMQKDLIRALSVYLARQLSMHCDLLGHSGLPSNHTALILSCAWSSAHAYGKYTVSKILFLASE